MNELTAVGLAIIAIWLTWWLFDLMSEQLRKLRLDNDLKELELRLKKKEASS